MARNSRTAGVSTLDGSGCFEGGVDRCCHWTGAARRQRFQSPLDRATVDRPPGIGKPAHFIRFMNTRDTPNASAKPPTFSSMLPFKPRESRPTENITLRTMKYYFRLLCFLGSGVIASICDVHRIIIAENLRCCANPLRDRKRRSSAFSSAFRLSKISRTDT